LNNANPEFVYLPCALPAIVYPKTCIGEGLMIESDRALPSAPVQTIAEIPRRYAVSNPDAIAVSFEGRETSYRALDELSNQVANGLVATGVRSASRIAILDKNSDIFFQILLGAAKARAVLVPINARLAPPEIAFAINDAQTEVLFVGEEFVEIISAIRDQLDTVRQIIVLNSLYLKWRDAQPLSDPGLPVSPDDVCVQLYTSGTTGYPKGVQFRTQISPCRPSTTGRGGRPTTSCCLQCRCSTSRGSVPACSA
jgi:acyl-CoA synthetase (AMP-forming)/AMP-acid ligase II